MVPTLIVKKPFKIDLTASVSTGMLFIDGGSILNVLTDELFVVHERKRVELPFGITNVYYDVVWKRYYTSESFDLESHMLKHLFSVHMEDGVIKTIQDIASSEEPINLGDLGGIVTKPAVNVAREENISINSTNGKEIPLLRTPREVTLIYIRAQTDTGLVPFGNMDLENIESFSTKKIILKLNLPRLVVKTLGQPVTNIILDVNYTY
jgi:hypothetical protein